MSILGRSNTLLSTNDYSLVMNSLGGDHNAFCQIVSRYQTLLCSLAYSSVGDIKHSEDIAQEVFVEAWKKLGTLHEPEKLKVMAKSAFEAADPDATNKVAEMCQQLVSANKQKTL